MADEQLIELVECYPVLYDTTLSQYRDNNIRNSAWEEIAVQLNETVDNVKERWGKLRNCLTNALKRQRKKMHSTGISITPWKYEKQMEFLLPYVDNRRTMNSLSKEGDINQDEPIIELKLSEESIPSPSSSVQNAVQKFASMTNPNPRIPSIRPFPQTSRALAVRRLRKTNDDLLKELISVMKTSHDTRQKRPLEDLDETDHFFLAMSKQLKKLPDIDQTEIKFQLHRLVHDAEINNIKRRDSDANTTAS